LGLGKMDFKKIISKIESIDGKVTTPAAPTLQKAVQLNEAAQLRVLSGRTTYVAEAKKKKDADDKTCKDEKSKKAPAKSKELDEAAIKGNPWVVHDGTKVKRFKTRADAKSYSEKNGGTVASSEYYADKIQKAPAKSKELDEGQLGELSNKTLGSYTNKAARGLANHSRDAGMALASGDFDNNMRHTDKVKKRYTGINKAVGKMSKDPADNNTESINQAAFENKFTKMVEAKKAKKPDFADLDKDGDKKEPMKKAAADKKKGAAPKKGVNPFAKKKSTVKESVDRKLSFKEMISIVEASGGQQQIDPIDKALFTWAQRVASQKFNESTKSEVYAGLIYERNGGRFEMYDVLRETKK
jgi:hypothetical protein